MPRNLEGTSVGSSTEELVTASEARAAAGRVSLPKVYRESNEDVRGYEKWYKKELDALNIRKQHSGGFYNIFNSCFSLFSKVLGIVKNFSF